MGTRHFSVLALLLTMLFNIGCSKVDSADLKTHGFYADYTARDNGSSVRVTANFSTSSFSNDTIKLSYGDNVAATLGGQTKGLIESTNIFGQYTYSATFNTSGAEQTVTINFERLNDISAPNSTVTLPAAFSLSSPAQGTVYTITNNSAINVVWAPTSSATSMFVAFDGNCMTPTGATSFGSGYRVQPDTGSYSITVNQLLQDFIANEKTPPASISSCNSVNISLTRTVYGVIDSNFGKGGKFIGDENRSTYIRINP
jgi:hypothetical protein